MAILIANKLLETETEAWYTFYVDTLEDIKDLPTSKTTGSSYKVKKLAKPASIAYCIEMAAQYALDDNDEWRLLYALRSDVADAILKMWKKSSRSLPIPAHRNRLRRGAHLRQMSAQSRPASPKESPQKMRLLRRQVSAHRGIVH